jgi:hypothetical protein
VIGRRAVFFIVSAVVCIALVPVSVPELRWVPEVVAVVYAVLAVLSALDFVSRSRDEGSGPDDAV